MFFRNGDSSNRCDFMWTAFLSPALLVPRIYAMSHESRHRAAEEAGAGILREHN